MSKCSPAPRTTHATAGESLHLSRSASRWSHHIIMLLAAWFDLENKRGSNLSSTSEHVYYFDAFPVWQCAYCRLRVSKLLPLRESQTQGVSKLRESCSQKHRSHKRWIRSSFTGTIRVSSYLIRVKLPIANIPSPFRLPCPPIDNNINLRKK